ncbi:MULTISPECIES: helix-turn-helix domain-containing protein [Lactobacillaceae]|uniref:helix-turn-helix domain-containing protein n=1 Tax=Lactobacillaceae TaxID=33958 RepID=UPI0014569210|nr:helix-turn-helix transcriptional regulator [Lactobacillus sp. HBUAS51381]NLR10661.1 helix-turn-helix transcriptional regulator [Lactobacillus sp. HBUAS51381]
MQPIGITLKQIRQSKGFTQREVYGNILSRSFASRLERGQHDVTAERLFQILDRLGVSANEFRFMQNNDQPTASELARSQVMLAYDQQNFPRIGHLATHYLQSTNPAERRIGLMATILITAFDQRGVVMTPAMTQLWQQLTLTKTWTLQDLTFGSVIFVLAVQQKASLPATIRKYHLACERYVSAVADPFHVMDTRASFDLVALQLLLSQKQYTAAQNFKRQFTAGHTIHFTNDGILEQTLSLWLWESYFGDPLVATRLERNLRQLPPSRFNLTVGTLLAIWGRHATDYHQTH